MHSTGLLLVWVVSLKTSSFYTCLRPICIYILQASPHVTPAWISHWACRGFLHGKYLLFLFAQAKTVHAPFAFISITHSIISNQASFMIGPSDVRCISMPYVIRHSSWHAMSSDYVAYAISCQGAHLSQSIIIYSVNCHFGLSGWCIWRVASIIMIELGSISLRYT